MKFDLNRSGINGTDPINELDDVEKRIISIISVDAVDGDGSTIELGVTSPTPSTSVDQLLVAKITKTPKRSPAKIQNTNQRSSNSHQIKKSDDESYLKAILDIKKHKLELIKAKFAFKKEQHAKTVQQNEELLRLVESHERRISDLEDVVNGEYVEVIDKD